MHEAAVQGLSGLRGGLGDDRGTFCADQLGPDLVPVIRSEVPAPHWRARHPVNGRAVNGIDQRIARLPVADDRLTNAQGGSQFRDAFGVLNCKVKWFHRFIITVVI